MKKLDDLITLPFYLEWMDDIVISLLVNKVCDKLKSITQHNFVDLNLNKTQERELAEEISDTEMKAVN